MSGVGHMRLTGTSLASAPPVLVPSKTCTSRGRRTTIVRAAMTCTVPSSELPVWDACPFSNGCPSTNVYVSELQPSACQAGGLQMEGVYSYASDSMKRLQQNLPGVPSGMEYITHAFLSGAAAVAATGQLQRAGYDWVHSVLIFMAWQQATTAQQKLAKSKGTAANATKSIIEAEDGLFKANKHLQATAASFSWQLLKALNDNGYQPGLAYEQLPLHFQVFAYSLLLKCGCLGSWGQPAYRQLPAIAACIRPGMIVPIPIQQYLGIAQHLPRICRDEMDGTWTGDAQVRIHPFQVVSEHELAKALGPDMLQPLFESGFAADLAAAAADLGVIDQAAAAEARSTSSTSSLAEVLMLKFSKACVGISTAVLVSIRRAQQQETSITASPAAVAARRDSDNSYCCLTSSCGGAGGGRRGSLTAVGSDGFDEGQDWASLVPVCKGTSSGQEEYAGAVVQTNRGRRRGLIHRIKSFVRRFHKH